jgi:hypothetical protein
MTANKKNKTATKKSTKAATKPGRNKVAALKATAASVAPAGKKTDEMPAALSRACNNIRNLMTKADTGDSAARYLVAVEVHRVMTDEKKYGKGSVNRIARELGYTSVLLYNYAKVAKAWPAAKFAKDSARLTVKKVPLSFWQFVVIAKVKDEKKRATMLNDALQGASSRTMEKAKVAAKPAGAKGEDAGVSFEARVASASALLTRSETEDASVAAVDELQVAMTEVAAMKAKLEELHAKMTARITKMSAALAAPSSSEQVTDASAESRSDVAAE